MYHSRCTAKNSWWWAERLPETCWVVIPIKLEFGASVGLIHKESVTMHSHAIIKKLKHVQMFRYSHKNNKRTYTFKCRLCSLYYVINIVRLLQVSANLLAILRKGHYKGGITNFLNWCTSPKMARSVVQTCRRHTMFII